MPFIHGNMMSHIGASYNKFKGEYIKYYTKIRSRSMKRVM